MEVFRNPVTRNLENCRTNSQFLKNEVKNIKKSINKGKIKKRSAGLKGKLTEMFFKIGKTKKAVITPEIIASK